MLISLGFDWFRPVYRQGPGGVERTRLMEKFIEQWPPHMREVARKMCDFRPESCERCRQLAWERHSFQRLRWSLEVLFGDPNKVLARWTQAADLDHLYERHLVHERHVFALLPPAHDGVRRRS